MRKAIGVSWLCATLAAASILLAEEDHKIKKELFQTSDRCFACHNGLSTSAGEENSIRVFLRPPPMAHSPRGPHLPAGGRRPSNHHPATQTTTQDDRSERPKPIAPLPTP